MQCYRKNSNIIISVLAHRMWETMLVITLLFPLSAQSQQLQVVSFEDVLTDNTAWNPETCHKLEDGRYCPVVKVQLNAPSCTFDGGNFKGKEPLFKTNEYWVYMIIGARHIVVRHPDYEVLDVFFDEINPEIVRLKEKHTYVLKLRGESKKGLEAVEKGEASSMLKQAQNYEQGTGSYNKDLGQALIWYEKAAEAGSVEAQDYLADVLYRGKNGYKKDTEKALRWNEACAKRGKTACYLPLAELYSAKKDQKMTIFWLRKYCEVNSSDIAQILRLGKLIGANEQEGFLWLQKASEAGNKEATLLCLEAIKRKSPQKAVPFYKRAIDMGDMVAANEYAQILMEGKYGIPKDEAEAKRLLSLAAKSVFNIYENYKSDDATFQEYIDKIPELLSKVKSKDVEAMISMILIYKILGDKDMTERMLTLARYNLSNGQKLPDLFDYYLEQKANYKSLTYDQLLYEGATFTAVDKENYFSLVKAVIDDLVLSGSPSFSAINAFSEKSRYNTPKDEATRMMVRWAKDFYEQDCLDKLSNPSFLTQLNISIHYKEHRRDNFENFQITYYDGTMAGSSEYAHRVILGMYKMAQQKWKLGTYPFYDNYKWAYKQLEKYAEQAEKKKFVFNNRIAYSSWIRKMKEEGFFWNLEKGKGSKEDVIKERGKQNGAVSFDVNGVTFNMIRVHADIPFKSFLNGRTIHLDSYLIGETEVTNELWKAVMNTTKGSSNPQCPAQASWDEWQQFLQKLRQLLKYGFRAPSQEEWVFAAQGGTKSKGYKYSGSDNIDEVAWYEGNAVSVQMVAKKKPNELGIYDMSGNALEWTDNSLSPVNCAGGGFHPVDPRWKSSSRCVVKPYENNSRCKTERELGLRLVLSIKKK